VKAIPFDVKLLNTLHIRNVDFIDTGVTETSYYVIKYRDYSASGQNSKPTKGKMHLSREAFLDMAELVIDFIYNHPVHVKPKKKKRKLQNT